MPESFFTEVKIPQQKTYSEILFPRVLSPNPSSNKLSVLTESIKANKSWLESLLNQSGAILFRGFPVSSPSDFNQVVEAFSFDELPYIGGAALRTNVVGRVFTANDSPPDQKIHFHHEMAYASDFPTKLFLFCEVEPGEGGETPIVLSHIIYEKMKQRYPDFVAQLEEHGLLYTRVMPKEDDPTAPNGRGWNSTFSTKDKSIAEQRAAKLGLKLEWMEDSDAVNVITGPVPAIKLDKTRQRKTWFNSMMVAYGSLEDERNFDPAKAVMFGNGKPLPAHAVYDCFTILDEESVAIPWQKGDVLLLDNLAVLHSRRPLIRPPRRILASLCK